MMVSTLGDFVDFGDRNYLTSFTAAGSREQSKYYSANFTCRNPGTWCRDVVFTVPKQRQCKESQVSQFWKLTQ